ncbi:MAG: pilus assembly protein PilP [Desulfobacter sp.]
MIKIIKIFCFLNLGLFAFCLFSCDRGQQAGHTDSPPEVISKTIITKVPLAESTMKKATGIDKNMPMTKPENGHNGDKTLREGNNESATLSGSGNNGKQTLGLKKFGKVKDMSATEEPLRQKALVAKTAEDLIRKVNEPEAYDPKGRSDPFIPLISEKKEEPDTTEQEGKTRPKRILTPLEKMDLSQIKLVAVVQMKEYSIAMVEEAGGKGYEVRIGTYIGKNGGQVSDINANSVMVKENFRDFKGKRRERFHEIKFHNNESGK